MGTKNEHGDQSRNANTLFDFDLLLIYGSVVCHRAGDCPILVSFFEYGF